MELRVTWLSAEKLSLALLSVAAFASTFFWREPLLHASGWLLGFISFYTFFYVEKRPLHYTILYLTTTIGVVLFAIAEDKIAVFAGWELVSVAGWGLIASTRGMTTRALEAAAWTFLTNRVGDIFWLAGVMSEGQFPEGTWIAVWVKSGAFPFSFWLIQAMYAPAPVSALLHSALLVGMGLYLPVRHPEWMGHPPPALIQSIAWGSASAAVIGALMARPPKAILAWTTASHLGMGFALWAAPQTLSDYLFHHSYLKAALFLLAGILQRGWLPFAIGAGVWSIAALALLGAAPKINAFFWIPELISIVALGRALSRLQGGLRLSWQGWLLLLPPVGLIALALPKPTIDILIGIGALSVGIYLGKWNYRWRIDTLIVRPILTSARFTDKISILVARMEEDLSHSLKQNRYILRQYARILALLERVWIPWGWVTNLRHMRVIVAELAHPSPALYAQMLHWGVLITLLLAVVWRFLR
ncbi:MAG: hypothetical protein NZ580_07480 [Bacteroidia bacterium]|nr:hypothetical protein [Bacteroidia bacterium]MDW8235939.1 proton-conducting transporter membrane subunit [Bacteroidia bacterium]